MTEPRQSPSPDDVRRRLEQLRADRGFVLPHHGALAAGAPGLHEAYLAMYRELTLEARHLDPLEKEFVWLMILVAAREAIGTHHLKLFREAGGTDEQAQAAFRLASFGQAAEIFPFVETNWSEFFGGSALEGYERGITALAGEAVPRPLVDLGLCALYATVGNHWGIATHISSAYSHDTPEEKIVEALSLIIWPVGVNPFVEACTIWHELMRSGSVEPSPPFRAWAEMPGQGAYRG